MNIAVVISTYNRVDDARINMEIIRNVWEKTNLFGKVNIVHSYNGKKEWYLEKYLEDSLIVTENKGHFHGAANLLDAGFLEIERCKWDVDYLVFLAADTWITKPDFILSLLNEIKEKKLYLATNTWDALPDKPGNVLKAMASDFFVLDYKWALDLNIFPLDYGKFKLRLCEKYSPASYATFKTTFNDLGLLMDTEFRWQEVAENSIVTIYGIEVNLKKESSILFHENGNIKHATFQDPVEVIFPDGSRYKIKANTPSSFYEDGAVKEAVFTDPLQIVFPNGSENTIIPNTKVVFHKNFKLKEARLSHPLTISDTNGLKNIIQSGVNIVFDNNLIVEQIYSLSNIKSIKIKTYLGTFSASLANPKCIYGPTPNHYYTCYITGISFYSNGNVKTLKTSEDKKRVNILGIPMLTNGLFQFYENGIIKNIKLLEAIEVMDYHGNIRKCEEYSEPFFNDDGTLNNCY